MIAILFLPVFIMFSQSLLPLTRDYPMPPSKSQITASAISGPILVGQGARQSYTIDQGGRWCLKASKSCQPTAFPE